LAGRYFLKTGYYTTGYSHPSHATPVKDGQSQTPKNCGILPRTSGSSNKTKSH
jgi:hypothetical protein